MAEVRLEKISKYFGETLAVEELSFEVGDGEFFVLLGPTGAGKTTTLRLIAGLAPPDAGAIFIDGAEVTRDAPATRDVAFVFQQYSLYPHYSVYDNLAFPLRAPGRRLSEDEIKRRVNAVAETLAITAKLGNRATQLSGGEMQRVSIGRALVREPAAFLMDEPLSSLDAKLRESLRVELKHLQLDLGATIVYVTHDQVEALTLADRIGVLHAGRLLQVGTPQQVYNDPASLSVAQQLGAPAINLLPAGWLGLEDSGAESVGVRPEDVSIADGAPPTEAAFADLEGVVEHVERLGAEDVVLFHVGEQPLRALLAAGQDFSHGDRVRVRADARRLLLFDDAGQRLRRRPDRASLESPGAGQAKTRALGGKHVS